jgi:phage terminase small subunit
MALTPKKHRFAAEYLIDLNATQAAIRAGYSKHTAYSIGHDLLKEPEISALIARLQAERAERTATDAAWVLQRLRDEADADVNDCYGEDGELLPIAEWPLIWRTGLMVGIETEELEVDGIKVGIVRKVKQSDRIKRIELIGRHVGVQAFKDRVEVDVYDGMADRVARAKARGAT